MKLVTFRSGMRSRIGVVNVDVVRDVSELLPAGAGLLEVIEAWDKLGPVLRERTAALPTLPLDSVELLAPIPAPRRNVFCVGKNYRDHVAEFGRSGYGISGGYEELPAKPILFSKATTSVTGPTAAVDPHQAITRELDYEGE
ncbi:MAG: fumarylacetoacetate hydrolase family protein, partial [Actinobacteria bacterium]|nr:fumarylacetoacetate hydrolase family protein [Actinomycetota bacterium]